MSNKTYIEELYQLTEQELICKNPANEYYLKTAYNYAIISGFTNKEKRKIIEIPLCHIRFKEDECSPEELEAVIIGIGNQAILEDLWDLSTTLNKGTVQEAIILLVNELRIKHQLLLQSKYINFFPVQEDKKPLQSDEWLQYQIEYYENELRYFKELKALGISKYQDIFQVNINPKACIQLSFDKCKVGKAIDIMFELLNNHLIKSTYKEFKRLFGPVGRQQFKKVEWLGSQAELKALFDLFKVNKLIDNDFVNQLAEQCFFSSKNSIIARTLGAVTSQNTYIMLAKEQDQSHILYELIKQLTKLKNDC